MSHQELSEQEVIRRSSLQKMRELGVEPYPAAQYHVNTNTKEIKQNFKEEEKNFQDVVIAGRLMSRRIMGKAAFAEIQDHECDQQAQRDGQGDDQRRAEFAQEPPQNDHGQ